jgi:putative hydrolase
MELIVVASVHSKLRSPRDVMTKRMLAAIEDPNIDILGHCTGRIVAGRGRPESQFDHEAVFTACRDSDVAVKINSRPERKDLPRSLLKLAVDLGCRFSIDTDAHAPGSARVAIHRLGPRHRVRCQRRPGNQHQSGWDVVETVSRH